MNRKLEAKKIEKPFNVEISQHGMKEFNSRGKHIRNENGLKFLYQKGREKIFDSMRKDWQKEIKNWELLDE